VVAARQENLPLRSARGTGVLGSAGPAGEARQGELGLEGTRRREPWRVRTRSGRACLNAGLGSHGTHKRRGERCVFAVAVPSLRQSQELLPSLPAGGVGGCRV